MPSSEIEHGLLANQDPLRIAAYGEIQLSYEQSAFYRNGSFVGSNDPQGRFLAVEPTIDDVVQQRIPQLPLACVGAGRGVS
jgi:hypothetical protein